MEDRQIVELYWQRNEKAIHETEGKYERYLMKIAGNVLFDPEDSREVVNDTYLKAWNSIPPQKPEKLSTYLGKIARQAAIDLFRRKSSEKRQGSQYAVSLSELEECVPDGHMVEHEWEDRQLADAISAYLRTLNAEMSNVFLCRYYFCDSIRDIAEHQGASESKIHSILHRIRKGLKAYLEQEGFTI